MKYTVCRTYFPDIFQHSNMMMRSSLCWKVRIPYCVLFNVSFSTIVACACAISSSEFPWRSHLSALSPLLSVFLPDVLESFWKVALQYTNSKLTTPPVCNLLPLTFVNYHPSTFTSPRRQKLTLLTSIFQMAEHTDLNFSHNFKIKYVIISAEVWRQKVFMKCHAVRTNNIHRITSVALAGVSLSSFT